MRILYLFMFFTAVILFVQCKQTISLKECQSNKIQVGVFEGYGGTEACIWETISAIKLDSDMIVRTITTSDIANNVLDSLDAIVIPGGSGSRHFLNLGTENHLRLKNFIASGKGAVGICAGAYFFSSTPEYASIDINGAQAIDIQHDNRGHGIVKFTLTEEGRNLFPEIANKDTSFVMYYEGPVYVKNESDSIEHSILAVMESDVHEENNAPSNMTNNKPFFIANSYGKGRVFSCIAHPEGTPGMMWMIPRMVRWTLGMPMKEYKQNVVNPNIFNREILMSIDKLKQESEYYYTLLYGTPEEKIAALDWLQLHHSWIAKRWVQGLLFDRESIVRVRAARYIADIQFLHYLPDMRAAYNSERDLGTKALLKEQLEKLESLFP